MAASILVDRVKISVQSSGVGAFQLGAAAEGFRGVEALVDGGIYSYAVESGSLYEVGQGVYNAGSTQFIRTPEISSNGNAAVSFPASVQLVFTARAADLIATGGSLPIANALGNDPNVAIGQQAATAAINGKASAASVSVLATAVDTKAPKVAPAFTESMTIATNGQRVTLTSGASPIAVVRALLHVENLGSLTNGLLVTAKWTGATGAPYNNNDCTLFEVYNNVVSNSENRSWGVSVPNAYNNIPVGVTDAGERTAVYGWAPSIVAPGYTHAGTLQSQIGVFGAAGFKEVGTPATAVVNSAIAGKFVIFSDSVGATVVTAHAVEGLSNTSVGNVQTNVAFFASATGGSVVNYSFYGNDGLFYNQGQLRVGDLTTQSSSFICARRAGNAYEFGHPDPSGYVCNLGATPSAGFPFLALCGEADTGNLYRTRGKKGVLISSDLTGALIFSRLTNANAGGQTPTESARFDDQGHLVLAATPLLVAKTPASAGAAGTTGEFCYDAGFVYVCIATNTWVRAPLATW